MEGTAMTKSSLFLVTALFASAFLLSQSPAQASKVLTGDKCVFESSTAVYGGGPPEKISITWRRSTGNIIAFSWDHGGVAWYSFAGNPGTMVEEPSGAYYQFNIGTTTAGYDSTRYQLKGYLAINIDWPAATFAAIYEGTGTSHMVANGKVNCS
jgi:hypothetical protein